MTPPVTTDALADQIEAKMKAMSLLGGDALRAATHDLGTLAYIHSTQIVRALRSEAAHQRVTAERDEARGRIETARGATSGWPTLDEQGTLVGKIMALAAAARQAPLDERGTQFVLQHLVRTLDAASVADTTNAELARLRAEGEAKDRALKDLEEASRPFAACVFNDNGDVALCTGRLDVHDWLRLDRAQRAALARAATAREG